EPAQRGKIGTAPDLAGGQSRARRPGVRQVRRHLRGEVSEGGALPGQGPAGAACLLRLPGGALAAPAHDQPDRVDVRDDPAENGEDPELRQREERALSHAPARAECSETLAAVTRLSATRRR